MCNPNIQMISFQPYYTYNTNIPSIFFPIILSLLGSRDPCYGPGGLGDAAQGKVVSLKITLSRASDREGYVHKRCSNNKLNCIVQGFTDTLSFLKLRNSAI